MRITHVSAADHFGVNELFHFNIYIYIYTISSCAFNIYIYRIVYKIYSISFDMSVKFIRNYECFFLSFISLFLIHMDLGSTGNNSIHSLLETHLELVLSF